MRRLVLVLVLAIVLVFAMSAPALADHNGCRHYPTPVPGWNEVYWCQPPIW